jgi:hypothetical protein
MPGPGRHVPIMLGLLLLAACAGAPPTPAPVATSPAAVATIAPSPVSPAKPPAPTPAVLKGLSDRAVTRLIGAPAFRRVDDPGAIWQYRDGACLLDLYLHADGPVYRVRHFEFRPRGGEAISADHCFARLAARHTSSGTRTR